MGSSAESVAQETASEHLRNALAITTAILDLIYSGEPVSAMQLHSINTRLLRALTALEGRE